MQTGYVVTAMLAVGLTIAAGLLVLNLQGGEKQVDQTHDGRHPEQESGVIASYLRLPISNHPESEDPLPPPAIHPTIGAAMGTVVALVAIAAALFVAAVYPTLLIAVATGMGIGVIALAVTIAISAFFRVRLPSGNDDLVFW